VGMREERKTRARRALQRSSLLRTQHRTARRRGGVSNPLPMLSRRTGAACGNGRVGRARASPRILSPSTRPSAAPARRRRPLLLSLTDQDDALLRLGRALQAALHFGHQGVGVHFGQVDGGRHWGGGLGAGWGAAAGGAAKKLNQKNRRLLHGERKKNVWVDSPSTQAASLSPPANQKTERERPTVTGEHTYTSTLQKDEKKWIQALIY